MRVRPTFEELIGLQTPTLQKPNRPALEVVRSAQFNVWNDAAGMAMLAQSQHHASAETVNHEVRTAAQSEGVPAHELKATIKQESQKQVGAIQAASSLARQSAIQQKTAMHKVSEGVDKMLLELQRRSNIEDARMEVDPTQNITNQTTIVNAPQTNYIPVNASTNVDGRTVNLDARTYMNQTQSVTQLAQYITNNTTSINNYMEQNNLTVNQMIGLLMSSTGPGGGPGGLDSLPPPPPPSLPPPPPAGAMAITDAIDIPVPFGDVEMPTRVKSNAKVAIAAKAKAKSKAQKKDGETGNTKSKKTTKSSSSKSTDIPSDTQKKLALLDKKQGNT